MNIVVGFNLVVVVLATDASALERSAGIEQPAWLETSSNILLVIYIFESFLRLFAYRRNFFKDSIMCFEFLVVIVDVAGVVVKLAFPELTKMPSATALRIIRLARLSRTMRLFRGIHEFYLIVSGFISAIRVIFYGSLVLTVIMIICAVLSVELLDTAVREMGDLGFYEDCPRCPVAFSSVSSSVITLVEQALLCDNWAAMNTPLMERHYWSGPFLVLVWMFVNLCLMNLLLSVIVDRAAERRDSDREYQIECKIQDFANAKDRLKQMCIQMDQDGNGELAVEEILDGYENNKEFFQLMNLMDVDKEEIDTLINYLDRDHSGSVSHDEFIDQLYKIRNQELRSQMVMVKCHVMQMHEQVRRDLASIATEVSIMQPMLGELSGRVSEMATQNTKWSAERETSCEHVRSASRTMLAALELKLKELLEAQLRDWTLAERAPPELARDSLNRGFTRSRQSECPESPLARSHARSPSSSPGMKL